MLYYFYYYYYYYYYDYDYDYYYYYKWTGEGINQWIAFVFLKIIFLTGECIEVVNFI